MGGEDMVTRPILPVVIVLPVLLASLFLIVFFTLGKKTRKGAKALRILRVAGIFALIFMINLRVQHKRYDMDVEMKNIDILFVLDTTLSMWAEDAVGFETRIEQAQADCKYIMEEMAGSNFSLIRFDNRAQILAPFTQDRRNVTDALSTIKGPDVYYAKGSSMNVPIEAMGEMLESSAEKAERSTVVFFLSDGEITDGSALESYEWLEPFIDAGAVLGYGSLSGGKMKNDGAWGYIFDHSTGEDAVSVIDEENLRLIASDLGIDYIRMAGSGNVDYILQAVKAGSTVSLGDTDAVVYDDTYYYYVVPLLLLILWELILFIRRRTL